jgi:hypothetical protein
MLQSHQHPPHPNPITPQAPTRTPTTATPTTTTSGGGGGGVPLLPPEILLHALGFLLGTHNFRCWRNVAEDLLSLRAASRYVCVCQAPLHLVACLLARPGALGEARAHESINTQLTRRQHAQEAPKSISRLLPPPHTLPHATHLHTTIQPIHHPPPGPSTPPSPTPPSPALKPPYSPPSATNAQASAPWAPLPLAPPLRRNQQHRQQPRRTQKQRRRGGPLGVATTTSSPSRR